MLFTRTREPPASTTTPPRQSIGSPTSKPSYSPTIDANSSASASLPRTRTGPASNSSLAASSFDVVADLLENLTARFETGLLRLEFRARKLLLALLFDRPLDLAFGLRSDVVGLPFGLGDDLLGSRVPRLAYFVCTRAGFVSDVLYDRIKAHSLEKSRVV